MSVVGVEANLGNPKVFRGLDRILPTTQRAIRTSWFAIGRDLKNEANKEIKRRPKSGIVYFIRTKSGKYKRHVASAPGETHANLSGKLRKSVSWKVHGFSRMDFGYGFATNANNKAPEYDIFVEEGTDKMKPRPSIENTVRKIQRTTQNHFQREIIKGFKKTR